MNLKEKYDEMEASKQTQTVKDDLQMKLILSIVSSIITVRQRLKWTCHEYILNIHHYGKTEALVDVP